MPLVEIADELCAKLAPLSFGAPVAHVYNPLVYGRAAYSEYATRFGQAPKEILLVGMNPGPWGMVQTGVPFGEVTVVRDWLDIDTPVIPPTVQHPKRPILGFDCSRSEVSGQRLWGWVKGRYGNPEHFFSRFFVANYCPLTFMEETGRNRTPNNLSAKERKPLLQACNAALRETVAFLKPRFVIGIGAFAGTCIKSAVGDMDVIRGHILHPSPASPKANKGWARLAEAELIALGVKL